MQKALIKKNWQSQNERMFLLDVSGHEYRKDEAGAVETIKPRRLPWHQKHNCNMIRPDFTSRSRPYEHTAVTT